MVAGWDMQCGLGASSQENRLWASCLVVYRDREGEGRGGWSGNSRSVSAFSSLFALQWFSHQTCLLNQGPPLTKTANYAPMKCPVLFFFVSPTGFYHSLLRFNSLQFLSRLLCLTYFSMSRSSGKTVCCISGLFPVSVQLSLRPCEEWRKTYGGF